LYNIVLQLLTVRIRKAYTTQLRFVVYVKYTTQLRFVVYFCVSNSKQLKNIIVPVQRTDVGMLKSMLLLVHTTGKVKVYATASTHHSHTGKVRGGCYTELDQSPEDHILAPKYIMQYNHTLRARASWKINPINLRELELEN